MVKCKICNEEFKGTSQLSSHVKTHGYTNETYIAKFGEYRVGKILNKKCKCCDTLIESKRTYCSNDCKFSDSSYNKTRSIKTEKIHSSKNKILECKKCGKETTDVNNYAGFAKKHLKEEHNIDTDDYIQYYNIKSKEEQEKFKCPYCKWTTNDLTNSSGWFTRHLESKHNLSPEQVVKQYPGLKSLWQVYFDSINKSELLKKEYNRIQCLECLEEGKEIFLQKISQSHLTKYHQITIAEYKQKYNVDTLWSQKLKEEQSNITIQNNYIGVYRGNKVSSLEINFKEYLDRIGFNYIHSYIHSNGKEYDFYFPEYNLLIEIDGTAYHLDRLESMSHSTISNSINDYTKNIINDDIILYRIRYDDKKEFNSVNEMFELLEERKYTPEYTINYRQIILSKKYYLSYIKHKGIVKAKTRVKDLIKFLRTFVPEYPYPESKWEFNNIVKRIKTYDYDKVLNNNIFNNNTSVIGVDYLKGMFHSFWKSSFKKTPSPYVVYHNDKLIRKVIENRLGLGSNNEVYDFSLKNINRGMSALRYQVSFFKPIVAASVYKHFLSGIENPTVIDPCSGFGGRMLGFKSLYPNGTYIGIEPNPDTFKELCKLAEKFDNIILYNMKAEDYIKNGYSTKCDLTFTSIPYFDTEIYSTHYNYSNESYWVNVFLHNGIFKFENKLINFPSNLRRYFPNGDEYFLKSNTSHFNKNKSSKMEYILKF